MASKFDPEGIGYDLETAVAAGLTPDPQNGHWPSRHPDTGQVLKGRQHPTWDLAEQADRQLGYAITKGKDGKYYSQIPDAPVQGPSEYPPAMGALNDIQMRTPYPSENDFFQNNKQVAGMAAEDNQVILNPHSGLNPDEKRSVKTNEKVRVWMRKNGVSPVFALTPEQKTMFKGYGSEEDIRHTILARAISGDPSTGKMTPEQLAEKDKVLSSLGGQR